MSEERTVDPNTIEGAFIALVSFAGDKPLDRQGNILREQAIATLKRKLFDSDDVDEEVSTP